MQRWVGCHCSFFCDAWVTKFQPGTWSSVANCQHDHHYVREFDLWVASSGSGLGESNLKEKFWAIGFGSIRFRSGSSAKSQFNSLYNVYTLTVQIIFTTEPWLFEPGLLGLDVVWVVRSQSEVDFGRQLKLVLRGMKMSSNSQVMNRWSLLDGLWLISVAVFVS